MDTFVGFTVDDALYGGDSFIDEYNLVYPNAVPGVVSTLDNKCQLMTFMCEVLAEGYKSSTIGTPDSFFEEKKVYWLLCNIRLPLFFSQLESFIIKKNDLTLSDEDYVLLFYISLQNDEVQNTIQNLPLSMKYDMFLPVAEENLRQWKLHS
jgi:hypothetical protein